MSIKELHSEAFGIYETVDDLAGYWKRGIIKAGNENGFVTDAGKRRLTAANISMATNIQGTKKLCMAAEIEITAGTIATSASYRYISLRAGPSVCFDKNWFPFEIFTQGAVLKLNVQNWNADFSAGTWVIIGKDVMALAQGAKYHVECRIDYTSMTEAEIKIYVNGVLQLAEFFALTRNDNTSAVGLHGYAVSGGSNAKGRFTDFIAYEELSPGVFPLGPDVNFEYIRADTGLPFPPTAAASVEVNSSSFLQYEMTDPATSGAAILSARGFFDVEATDSLDPMTAEIEIISGGNVLADADFVVEPGMPRKIVNFPVAATTKAQLAAAIFKMRRT